MNASEVIAEANATGLRGRERQVWLLAQCGRSAHQIAAELGISVFAAQKARGRATRKVYWHRIIVSDQEDKPPDIPRWAWAEGDRLREAMTHSRAEVPNPLRGREADTAHLGCGVHAQRLSLRDYALAVLAVASHGS